MVDWLQLMFVEPSMASVYGLDFVERSIWSNNKRWIGNTRSCKSHGRDWTGGSRDALTDGRLVCRVELNSNRFDSMQFILRRIRTSSHDKAQVKLERVVDQESMVGLVEVDEDVLEVEERQDLVVVNHWIDQSRRFMDLGISMQRERDWPRSNGGWGTKHDWLENVSRERTNERAAMPSGNNGLCLSLTWSDWTSGNQTSEENFILDLINWSLRKTFFL